MRYISTRGSTVSLSFEDVLLTGLAHDGGLYIPEKWLPVSSEEIRDMASMNYMECAYNIMRGYIEEQCIGNENLNSLINDTYAIFDNSDVAPLIKLNENTFLLELFHGPTLAFKDLATRDPKMTPPCESFDK